MNSECTTVMAMAEKRIWGSRTQTINVRNFPTDLVEMLQDLRREKEIFQYAFIRDAVYEKIMREYPERFTDPLRKVGRLGKYSKDKKENN